MNDKELKIVESFNGSFCSHLEYHLCDTFAKSDKDELKGFWCDGVSCPPPNHSTISKKRVNDTRKIETIAWLGKTGQDENQMTIKFGKKSLNRYSKGASLIDCLPNSDTLDWINIDTKKRPLK